MYITRQAERKSVPR